MVESYDEAFSKEEQHQEVGEQKQVHPLDSPKRANANQEKQLVNFEFNMHMTALKLQLIEVIEDDIHLKGGTTIRGSKIEQDEISAV